MKKFISTILSVLMIFSLVGCNGGESSGSSSNSNVEETVQKEISIPTVTVDLYNPENRVVVSETEPSTVIDQNGRTLTDKEWLLNSKFSKSYIRSLGVGTYTFQYSSAKEFGTITLIIKDEQNPNYVFYFEMDELVEYDSKLLLPKMVKNPDSYQEDCTVDYKLYKDKDGQKEEIAFVEYNERAFTALDLTGSYTWQATVSDGENPFEYERAFSLESYETYKARVMPTMVFNAETNKYCPYDGEYITLDSMQLGTMDDDQYDFNISNEEILKQISLGNDCATLTFESTNGDFFGVRENGATDTGLWVTNGWSSWFYSITAATDGETLTSNLAIVKTTLGDNSYRYVVKVRLEEAHFSNNQPLQMKFTYNCRRVCRMTVEFGSWEVENA